MSHRLDIQALRGIAVLLVVFYHARLLPIANGFLGVDIFFVISGFLITTQITKQLNNGDFSFAEFYLRRAWRLLPAAYAVFIACCLVAPWALSYSELQDFLEQLWGAISFSANFVLWSQTGYFEDAADLKPLLHTWSLSIEEQYYLLMPAILAITPRNIWLLLISVLSILSLGVYLLQIDDMPGAVFYFTPTRVWELGVGSALALLLLKREYSIPNWCSAGTALIAILAIFYTVPYVSVSKLNLIITVFSTALVIAARPVWLNTGKFVDLLSRVGAISYSLYLVHWPIIAFLNSANISGNVLWWPYRVFAVFISIALAWTLYHLVEMRFRITTKRHSKSIKPIILWSLLVLSVSFGLSALSKDARYEALFRINNGLSEKCSSPSFYTIADCKTSEAPTTLLWGDSFAMHLAPGLKLTTPEGLIQAAKHTCLPISGISFYNPPDHNRSWAKDCIDFNEQVERHAIDSSTIELVVLASLWQHMLTTPVQLVNDGNSLELSSLSIADITSRIAAMVSRIQASAKKVVVVAPPPGLVFDIAKCHERRQRGQWRISKVKRSDCRIDYLEYKSRSKKVIELMTALDDQGIAVYWFDEKLCNGQHCETKLDEVILYRDNGHFSHAGSEYYATEFELFKELKLIAN